MAGRVAAIANQVVALDAATSAQLTDDAERSQCPLLVAGGYSSDPSRGIVRHW